MFTNAFQGNAFQRVAFQQFDFGGGWYTLPKKKKPVLPQEVLDEFTEEEQDLLPEIVEEPFGSGTDFTALHNSVLEQERYLQALSNLKNNVAEIKRRRNEEEEEMLTMLLRIV